MRLRFLNPETQGYNIIDWREASRGHPEAHEGAKRVVGLSDHPKGNLAAIHEVVASQEQNSEPRCRLVHFGSPSHCQRQRQPDMCLIRQEQASTARRSWRSHERDLAILFWCVRPAEPGRNKESRTTRPECVFIVNKSDAKPGGQWSCVQRRNTHHRPFMSK